VVKGNWISRVLDDVEHGVVFCESHFWQKIKDFFCSLRVTKLFIYPAGAGGLTFAILYGSRARGDFSWHSNIDLVICSPAFENVRVLDRFDIISGCSITGMFVIEAVSYSPREAIDALDAGRRTILDALQEGVVLIDDGSVLPALCERFEALKAAGSIALRDLLGRTVWDVHGLTNR
jgi:hypothetical protein